jgi:NCS1 family nucleobase:cation symporter-1
MSTVGQPGVGADEAPYEAFTVEKRGIDIIPPEERVSRPINLFWIWAGAIVNIEYVVYGTFLVIFLGLSFPQAIGIIVLGNIISWTFLGLASLQGPDAGTTAFMLTRAAYGNNGARPLSIFNWLTQVGYETEGITLVVLAALALLAKAGVHNPHDWIKVVLIIAAASVQLVLPYFGHATISKVFRVLTFLFVALFVVLAILVAGKANVHLAQHAKLGELVAALALAVALGGLGWTENANDYSRYMPKETPKARIFWAATLGAVIPAILLEVLGAVIATAVSSATDPISGLPKVFPGWFLIPYLLVAIVQLFVINTMDLYSSALTLQAVGIKLARWQAVVVDTILCAILTYFVIFSKSFNKALADFVLFTIVWIAPWCAIFLVDWLLRRGRYDPMSLAQSRGGLYYRNGGWHTPALIAQALGMFAAFMWINAYPAYLSPLTNRTGGADLSWLMGLVVAGVTYYLLARHHVRQEGEATLPDSSAAGATVGAAPPPPA